MVASDLDKIRVQMLETAMGLRMAANKITLDLIVNFMQAALAEAYARNADQMKMKGQEGNISAKNDFLPEDDVSSAKNLKK